jgi:PKD repeat protein
MKPLNFQIFKLAPLIVLALGLNSCISVSDQQVKAGFTVSFVNNSQVAPVTIQIDNQTTGAEFYEWSFERGKPYDSKEKNPPPIFYPNEGTFKITLRAWNIDGVTEIKETIVQVSEPIVVDFSAAIVGSVFPPVEAKFTNLSKKGNQFLWTFEGGNPATSTDKEPSVFFEQGGEHKVSLKVGNGQISKQKDTVFVVMPNLLADFDFVPTNANMKAPLNVKIQNKTVGAGSYYWTTTGGDLSDNTAKEPTLDFRNAGTYTITLEALNDKKSRKVEKSITVQ